MTDLDRQLKEAREEGRSVAEVEQAKSELRFYLTKLLVWFVIGCLVGGGVAIHAGVPSQWGLICAVGTGFVFSFIKWIILAIFLLILGC